MEGAEKTLGPPRQLLEVLIRQVRDLKMLPDVAIQAIAIADNPDSKIVQLVDVVAQDIKLTADILALSNCSLFGSTKPALCLQQAIMRLGFRLTKSMILASSITSMMQKMPWQEVRIRDLLCEHSLLTAILCTRLNGLFQLGMQGEEFTGGLIHDLGRTLLAVSLPEEFGEFDGLDFVEPENMLDREMNAIGTTHAEVGAWFLERNHLPDELVTVARYHHAPQNAKKFPRLVAVTAVADDLANFCHRNEQDQVFECAGNRNLELLEYLGVDSAISKLEESSAEIMEAAKDGVQQMLKFT
jgi:HD-like signal output (HDOD) protein